MADIVDITEDRQASESVFLLAASKKPTGPAPSGFCHFCEEALPADYLRFCDPFCRDGYEYRLSRLVANRQ